VLDSFIENINKAGSIFKQYNKILYYHNHALEFQKINDELILDSIYNNTDSQLIQGEPDILDTKGCQNPIPSAKN